MKREPRLDENQERWLCVTFEYIDGLLSEVEGILDGSPVGSAFPRNIPDIPLEKRQAIREAIPPIRHQLVQVLDSLAIQRKQKAIPVSRTIRTNLATIDITLEELKRKEWGIAGDPCGNTDEIRNIIERLREMVSSLEQHVDDATNEDSSSERKRG